MKKTSILTVLIINCSIAFCQNVGIGTTSPATLLHVKSATDSTLLTLESTAPLAAGKSMDMLFKNGGYYAAGIRSIGTSASTARLGFSTMSPGFGPSEMTERLTISDDGNVGIGTISPAYKLHVTGVGYFVNTVDNSLPAIKGVSTVNSRYNPGVVGVGESIGVLGNANTTTGTGIFGYNNVASTTLQYITGTGVNGFSSGGHAIAGITTKTGSASIYGSTTTSGAYAAQFNGALAVLTSGPLRFTGISEGAGKVLTSDGSGNATWQTPTGGGTTVDKIAFSAYLGSSIDIKSDTLYNLANLNTEYQFGSSFNGGEGLFIAPSDGVYQFTFRVSFLAAGSTPVFSQVNIRVNGSVPIGGEFNHITPGISGNNGIYEALNYTKTMNLSAGSNVNIKFKLKQQGASYITVGGDANSTACFFSGIKLL